MYLKKIVLLSVFFFSNYSFSQVDLFESVEIIGGGISPPQTSFGLYNLDINFDQLKEFPESLTLPLPNGDTTVVPLNFFAPRKGYIYRDEDTDPPGTPPFWTDPNLDNSEFSYSWQGVNDDYTVLLTVNNGQLIGMITGIDNRYSIKLDSVVDNTYILSDIRLEGYRSNDAFENGVEQTSFQYEDSQTDDNSYISHYKEIELKNLTESLSGTGTTVLDVLIVWSEAARVGAGGTSDPNDTQGIDTMMITAIDDLNLTLTNSQINTRVTKFHTAKLTGFTVAPVNSGIAGALATRNNFRIYSQVTNLRNTVGADVVVGIITDDFPACGVAYVQTKPGCSGTTQGSCGVGTAFDSYAYALASFDCAIDNDTFSHEIGHLMCGNHVQSTNQLTQSWIDDIIDNTDYDDAFAQSQSGFDSIMSTSNSRQKYFSNPNVSVNGIPTGAIGTKNNARIVDELSPVMEGFRTRPDLIFIDGFE